jgi:hypothetical protein
MELLVVILIIFLLMGLLIVGVRYARSFAKGTSDAQAVNATKIAVSQFNTEFKFFPPLVKDQRPLTPGNLPNVYSTSSAGDAAALRGSTQDPNLVRFSIYSLAYYIVGDLEVSTTPNSGTPVDGVPGPGFMTPKRDGSFEKSGRRFDPFYDVSKNAAALFSPDAAAGKVVLRDSHEVALRYYRWLHGNPANNNLVVDPVKDLNIPWIVGDASDPTLRSAEYAVVAAGPNGVYGDEAELPSWHPQSMTWAQMQAKVGVSGDSNDPVIRQKIKDAARADNIVGVGP